MKWQGLGAEGLPAAREGRAPGCLRVSGETGHSRGRGAAGRGCCRCPCPTAVLPLPLPLSCSFSASAPARGAGLGILIPQSRCSALGIVSTQLSQKLIKILAGSDVLSIGMAGEKLKSKTVHFQGARRLNRVRAYLREIIIFTNHQLSDF